MKSEATLLTETVSRYNRYRSVKQDYPVAGKDSDASLNPPTAQQGVATLNLFFGR